jgi:SAM-dependent methyltransferase
VSRTDGPTADRTETDVFASGAYWREYYSSLGHENRVAGEFLLEAATSLAGEGNLSILDAGCGPTVLYWAVFVPGANKIHAFDLNGSNIRAVEYWIERATHGHFDEAHLEAASHALALRPAKVTPQQHLQDKACQVRSLRVADLSLRWPYEANQFDFVQSCFAFECLPTWRSFGAALAEARRVLRPGGRLAFVNVAHGVAWNCGGQRLPLLSVTADRMREKLEALDFRIDVIRDVESTDANWREQGYGNLLLTCATKVVAPSILTQR